MDMDLFQHPEFDHHEQIIFCNDRESGLKAIIAIHNTTRGPGVGGCRMRPYKNTEEALRDVLRLSRGMTYKSGINNLHFGGGKSVIIGDPKTQKTPALLQAMGRFVEKCSGGYIIAEDMNIGPKDLEIMASQTQHVTGLEKMGSSGNPSPVTAHGVFSGLKSAVEHKLGRQSLEGIKIAIQGTGSVGAALARELAAEGAILFVADINEASATSLATETGGTVVPLTEIYSQDVDVFSPCAIGGILNTETIDQLKATIIAGAANNQLARPEHGQLLHDKGILYAPDYVINAGGIINIHLEFYNKPYDRTKAMETVEITGSVLTEVFDYSEKHDTPTHESADIIAETRFKPSKKSDVKEFAI